MKSGIKGDALDLEDAWCSFVRFWEGQGVYADFTACYKQWEGGKQWRKFEHQWRIEHLREIVKLP